jgi:cell division protein FtsL
MVDTVALKRTKKSRKADIKHLPILQWAGVTYFSSFSLFLVLSLVLVSGLFVVATTHHNRFAFNELQELREQANQLEMEWGQLLIEQSTFGVEGRIEQKALEKLQMEVPDISSIVMVSHEQR